MVFVLQAFRLAEQAASQVPASQNQRAAAGPGRPLLDASAIIRHVRAAQEPFALLQVSQSARVSRLPDCLILASLQGPVYSHILHCACSHQEYQGAFGTQLALNVLEYGQVLGCDCGSA